MSAEIIYLNIYHHGKLYEISDEEKRRREFLQVELRKFLGQVAHENWLVQEAAHDRLRDMWRLIKTEETKGTPKDA